MSTNREVLTDFHHLKVAAVAVGSAALTACGGGGGGADPHATNANGDASAGTTAVDPTPPTASQQEDAARFLAQAALSATPAAVSDLATKISRSTTAYTDWLDAQFKMAPGPALWDAAVAFKFYDVADVGGDNGMDNLLWWRLFTAQDELRQRVVLALSELFVVSVRNMGVPWGQFNCLAYWDMLEQHCFGTFRDLVEAVTLSPAMGAYLSMRGSQKAGGQDGSDVGRRPDENYARELMQLFTIGLVHLDLAGRPIAGQGDTYNNDDVTNLAKALTGWDFVGTVDYAKPTDSLAYTRLAMQPNELLHDTSVKTVLGQSIPASQDARTDLKGALDIICSHPNVAPFIARQLIQRLVSSNPEPAHIQNVATVFNASGGDMKAVITAVLTDPLARAPLTGDQALRRCKLREPLLRFIQWGRMVGLTSTLSYVNGGIQAPAGTTVTHPLTVLDWWNIGDLSAASRLAQSPLRSPSVFNFFRPGYVPLNSGLSADGFVAPEFQITDESSVIGYANFMRQHIAGAPDQFMAVDYSHWLALAADASQLVDNLNLLLTGRALAPITIEVIVGAVGSLDGSNQTALRNRVMMAFYLMLVSPDYMVQR